MVDAESRAAAAAAAVTDNNAVLLAFSFQPLSKSLCEAYSLRR